MTHYAVDRCRREDQANTRHDIYKNAKDDYHRGTEAQRHREECKCRNVCVARRPAVPAV
jgi:hypothetical protein